MTDYGRVTLRASYSEDENHVDPEWQANWSDYDVTPDEGHSATVEVGTSSTTIIANTLYSTMSVLVVQNLDPVGGNSVDVSWTDNDANANTTAIPAGLFMMVPDVDGSVAVTAQASNSAVKVRVVAMGT
jgi:hypothetical protein